MVEQAVYFTASPWLADFTSWTLSQEGTFDREDESNSDNEERNNRDEETSGILQIRDYITHVHIKAGRCYWGKNGFYHAFRMSLAELGTTATISELKSKCKKFAKNNPPPWFLKSLIDKKHSDPTITQENIDSYICELDDRRGNIREGRILCQLYNTKLYILHPYHNAYYITCEIDEYGVRHSNNIDFEHRRVIYIIMWANEEYQMARIDTSKHNIAKSSCATSDANKINSSTDIYHQDGFTKTDHKSVNDKRKQMIQTKLKELRNAIIEGKVDCVKNIDDFMHDHSILYKTTLDDLDVREKSLTKNKLIVLACKHKRAEVLYYLLNKTNLLYYLAQESSNTGLEHEERLEAFRYAMCSDNFYLVELLYDYWCGGMHGLRRDCFGDDDVIHDLEELNRLLNEASDKCKVELLKNYRMQAEVQCLVKFNAYQVDLYTELRGLNSKFDYSDKSKEAETERVRLLVHKILSVHEKHSDINRVLLNGIPNKYQDERQFLMADGSSLYMRILMYLGHEVYFRKLDFNVSLHLLDNLHVLKKRLVTPEQSYQKLECALYHYIYRSSEYWRLYLPYHRSAIVKINKFGLFKGLISTEESLPKKLLNGPVLFFERRQFEKYLRVFKNILETINIKNQIRKDNIPSDEINALTLLPFMRDDYSLQKILDYMKAVDFVDIKQDVRFGFLIIERVIQVIGEMFKTSIESLHLSLTTKSFLHTFVSVDTLKALETLRTTLSHAEDGQLTKKIKIENTERELLERVKTDLKSIIKGIFTYRVLHMAFLDLSIISGGVGRLTERLDELPPTARFIGEYRKTIVKEAKAIAESLSEGETKQNEENIMMMALCSELGISRQLLEEITLIKVNLERLILQGDFIKQHMICVLFETLPKYLKSIRSKLKIIKYNNEKWSSIQAELPKFENLMDHPTHNDVEKVTNTLRRVMKKGQHIDDKLIEKTESIEDYKRDWESIKEFLRFLFEDVKIFGYSSLEVTNRCLTLNRLIVNSCPNDKAISHAYEFVDIINNELECRKNKYNETYEPKTLRLSELSGSEDCLEHEYTGIGDLVKLFGCGKRDNSQHNTEAYNLKIKKTLLFEGLIDRVDLLKKAMDHPKKLLLCQHMLRYESDQKFRIVIEMLLADIMSVFRACKIDSLLIKSSNILTEINLRNVLVHGNPFVEVIGEALASRDFTSELLTWARSILDDSASIEALYSLFQDNIDYDAIKNDSRENMTTQQQKWLEVFKQSNKWQEYLKLIPKNFPVHTQNIITPSKPNTANEEALVKLIAAVQNKDMKSVMLNINDVDLDLVDRHGKAAVHYAAMKGHIDILQVLLQNGAKANVADGTNGMRPLHYAARNGMAAAVNMLFHYGADTTVEDNHNRLPLYYVNRNNHELAEQLARQLTVQMGFHLSNYTIKKC